MLQWYKYCLDIRALRNCLFGTKTWLNSLVAWPDRPPLFKSFVRSVYNLTTKHWQAFIFLLIGSSGLPIIRDCGTGQRHVQTTNRKHLSFKFSGCGGHLLCPRQQHHHHRAVETRLKVWSLAFCNCWRSPRLMARSSEDEVTGYRDVF